MMRHISLLKLSKLTGDYFFDSKEVKQESGMSCIFIVLFLSPGRQDRTNAFDQSRLEEAPSRSCRKVINGSKGSSNASDQAAYSIVTPFSQPGLGDGS